MTTDERDPVTREGAVFVACVWGGLAVALMLVWFGLAVLLLKVIQA